MLIFLELEAVPVNLEHASASAMPLTVSHLRLTVEASMPLGAPISIVEAERLMKVGRLVENILCTVGWFGAAFSSCCLVVVSLIVSRPYWGRVVAICAGPGPRSRLRAPGLWTI